MSRASHRQLLPLAWLLVPLALPLVITGIVVHLGRLRAQVDGLEQVASAKRAELETIAVADDEREFVTERRGLLEDWNAMVASDSRRVAEISRLALDSGVTLRSLRAEEPAEPDVAVEGEETVEGDRVRVESHRVRVAGEYRQIAAFLGAVQVARGVASIERLTIKPGEGADASSLRASLVISWYGIADEGGGR